MRILLAHAIDTRNSIESLFAPLGLGYLAAYLHETTPDVEVRIAQVDVESAIDEFRPDVVGVSSVTQNFGLATSYARYAKERGIPVVAGGTHISMLPESLPPEMDVGVIGEGERTLAEILAVLGDGGFRAADLANIDGVVYRTADGAIATTTPRTPIDPLDELPRPARDLLGTRRYAPAHLFSSRGCPYRCVFCASTRFWPKIRAFSPDYVVSEVESLLEEYRPNLITFYDDLFIYSAERLAQIVERIEARGINKRVEFAISARANLLNEPTVDLLRRMNVVSVSMGLESGCERTLEYLKPRVTLAQNRAAVKLLHSRGMAVNASFVIGAPDETAEDILETMRFIRSLPLNIVNTYLLTPLPGTPVWDEALEAGLVSADMDFSRLAIGAEATGRHVHLSRELEVDELLALYERFGALSRSKRRSSLVKQAMRNPGRILPYIVRRAASA